MSETYTTVSTLPETVAFAFHGRMSRDDAIAQARDIYQHQKERIDKFLATPDAEVKVEIVRGLHVQHLIKILEA